MTGVGFIDDRTHTRARRAQHIPDAASGQPARWTKDRAVRAREDRRLLERYHHDGDTRRARGAGRALPAARPPARPPLPARRRAARRPRAGRLARAAEGDRPLRPRARDRVLLVRRPDDPRRAQAPLPRQGLVRARAARPPGARGARRARGRGARAARWAARPRPAEIAESDRRDRRAGARGPRGGRRLPRRLAGPPARRRGGGRRRHRRRGRASRTPASAWPRPPRPSSA